MPTREVLRDAGAPTWTGTPSRVAPSPSPADQVRPSATLCTQPARTVQEAGSGGPATTATDTAQEATPYR